MTVGSYIIKKPTRIEASSKIQALIDVFLSDNPPSIVLIMDRNDVWACLPKENAVKYRHLNNTQKKLSEVIPRATYETVSIDEKIIPTIIHMLKNKISFMLVEQGNHEIGILALSQLNEFMAGLIEQSYHHAEEVDSYVQILSHDIRSPLNVISLCSNVLLSELESTDLLSEENVEFIRQIDRNARQAHGLALTLLDIGALKNKDILNYEPVKIESFLNKIASDAKIIASQKQISVHVDVAEDFIITMDQQRMQQVIDNLLVNAIKFTGMDKSTTLRASILENESGFIGKIEVIDQGRGIAEKDCERIFTPYEQIDVDAANNLGVGLGLSIAYKYVKSHRGSITVTSELGKGSNFCINLPGAEKIRSALEQEYVAGFHLLVVDDDPDIAEYLESLLLAKGYLVTKANSVSDAINKFHSCRPNMIISDIRMPGSNGLELLAEVKTENPNFPVILISGYSRAIKESTLASMYTNTLFFEKPFNTEVLYMTIQKYVDLYQDSIKCVG